MSRLLCFILFFFFAATTTTMTASSLAPRASRLAQKSIVVVGGGGVGSTLAQSMIHGNVASVTIAARDPTKTLAKFKEEGKDVENLVVKPVPDAIQEADIVVLAVPGGHKDEAIAATAESLGGDRALANKIVIDATNPLSTFPSGLHVRWEQGTSGAEVLQTHLPNAKIYKAFNTLGRELMARPRSEGVDMLYCGGNTNDKDDRAVVEAVISAVGFVPRYVGPLRYARNLEAMAELWIHCAIPALPGHDLGRDWSWGFVEGNTGCSSGNAEEKV